MMSASRYRRYTARVRASDPDSETVFEAVLTSPQHPDDVMSEMLDTVPDDLGVERVGIWTGTLHDEPPTGHEIGLLNNEELEAFASAEPTDHDGRYDH